MLIRRATKEPPKRALFRSDQGPLPVEGGYQPIVTSPGVPLSSVKEAVRIIPAGKACRRRSERSVKVLKATTV